MAGVAKAQDVCILCLRLPFKAQLFLGLCPMYARVLFPVRCVVFLFCLAVGKQLSAQIVNVEEYRIRADSAGWAGSADASVFLNKNNDFIFSILTNTQLQHKRPKTLWLMVTDLSLVQADAQDAFVNAGFLHFRMNYKLSERWTWEAFAQGQFNGPLGVEWKILSGTGPRYRIMRNDKLRVYAAALYMQETERNTGAEENIYFNRMSSYVSFTWEPYKQSRISNTTYFQPVLDDWDDFRISSNTSLKAFLTKYVYLELEYNIFFDTRPPTDIPTTVYTLKSGIGLEF